MSTEFTLLYVCTGNDARSPLAAACMTSQVSAADVRWQISSAGTHASSGDFARPEAQRAAATLDLDLSRHRTRPLEAADCEDPDLILTMGWDEASHIWSVVPEVWDKVFTIKEFVHWAKEVPLRPDILFADRGEQMRDKISQAHELRRRARSDHGFWGGLAPGAMNLVEPNGLGEDVWGTLAGAVQALVSDVITLLAA